MDSEGREDSLRLLLTQLAMTENSAPAELQPRPLRRLLPAGVRFIESGRSRARRSLASVLRTSRILAGRVWTTFFSPSGFSVRMHARSIAEALRGHVIRNLLSGALVAGRSRTWAASLSERFPHLQFLRAPAGARPAAGNPSTAESIRQHIRASLIAVCVLVVIVGGWAATAEFAGAVIAPGSLVVDGNVKKLQHPTGGVVDELRVRDGDRVKAGDILIRLDQTQAAVNLSIVAKGLDELLIRQARLEAERDGLDDVDLPVELLARAIEDPDLGKIVSGERRFFETRRISRRGQQSQLKERVSQLREQILGLNEQIAAKKREMTLIERELAGVQELYRKNLIPLQRVTALERDAARIEGEHGAMIASIAQTKARITETELQILQIDQDLRAEVGRELADARAKIAELSERKIGAEDQLRRIDIRAPRDGAVHQLAVHTVGGVIGPGEALMLIVPDSEELSVEVRLPPEKIDQVRAGQPAVLRFSAFNQRTTPEINGNVSRVSADLLTDQRTGMAYYLARITISAAEAHRLGQKLLPGMPVEAFIHTGDRTVLTYITKPFTDQMRRAFRER